MSSIVDHAKKSFMAVTTTVIVQNLVTPQQITGTFTRPQHRLSILSRNSTLLVTPLLIQHVRVFSRTNAYVHTLFRVVMYKL